MNYTPPTAPQITFRKGLLLFEARKTPAGIRKSLHSTNEAVVFPPLPKAWFGAALPRLMKGGVGWAVSLFLSTDTKKHTNKDT